MAKPLLCEWWMALLSDFWVLVGDDGDDGGGDGGGGGISEG